MIAGTGFEKKHNEPTRFPRGNGIEGLTMKSIDKYILHDRSVGVCFSNISAYFA